MKARTNLKEEIRFLMEDEEWKNKSRIYGEVVERWLCKNQSCPSCGRSSLHQLKINTPFTDLRCDACGAEFQVKASSKGFLNRRTGTFNKLPGASYLKSLEGLQETNRPDWILVEYCRENEEIKSALLIDHRHVTKESLVPRNPLSQNARRSGWQGCTWDFRNTPYARLI